MEAKHHECNKINRTLACMRKVEDRLATCLVPEVRVRATIRVQREETAS